VTRDGLESIVKFKNVCEIVQAEVDVLMENVIVTLDGRVMHVKSKLVL